MFATASLPRNPLPKIATLVSVLALSACGASMTGGFSGPQTGQPIDPRQPVQVALLVPGNSGNADVNNLSRSLVNAARMAVADAQGAKIDLRVYETGASPERAAAQADKAVADGARIIIGPLFADAANAAANAVKDDNVNVLSFSNNADIAGGNLFVLGNTFDNVADRLVGYGVRQGKRRVLLVAEDDVAGQVGAHAIERAIARNGASLAGKATHNVSKAGIDGVIPKVAAAAKENRADAIFMTANAQPVLPYLTDGLAAQGVTSATTQFMGLTRWDTPSTRLQLPGTQGGWFAIPDTTLKAQFDQRYRAANSGAAPHDLASLAYDGVSAIAALAAKGRRDTVMTSGLTSNSGFAGVGGTFRLRPDGTNQRGLAVATIRDKQVVILEPAPRSFRGAGF
ncbi:MAG: penicillin-binding protein activator [Paracoccus sp. (in: a-proteobacteria)]|uniref:penicillin-binding protein activator n=1 Tax=Paracoccus sp. TaxID=267 RepID=UPI0026E0D2C8|nr:penicillin-binding protein activator [Paracoccus sp. (in: a-proteobacteria)]MDO5621039.1 penicillin-binding protein activator [Paracoccus sp. (in: a-proteobacteria)]